MEPPALPDELPDVMLALPPAPSTLDPAVIEMSPPVAEEELSPTLSVIEPACPEIASPVEKIRDPDETSLLRVEAKIVPLEERPFPLKMLTVPPTEVELVDEPEKIVIFCPAPLELVPTERDRAPATPSERLDPVETVMLPAVPAAASPVTTEIKPLEEDELDVRKSDPLALPPDPVEM